MKSRIEKIVNGKKTEKQIVAALNKSGIKYSIDDECGYMNIKIQTANGYIRIFKSYRGDVVVQEMKKTICEYSGIPTFFGSSGIIKGG